VIAVKILFCFRETQWKENKKDCNGKHARTPKYYLVKRMPNITPLGFAIPGAGVPNSTKKHLT